MNEQAMIDIFSFFCKCLSSDSEKIHDGAVNALLAKLKIDNDNYEYYQQIINKCDGVHLICEAMEKQLSTLNNSRYNDDRRNKEEFEKTHPKTTIGKDGSVPTFMINLTRLYGILCHNRDNVEILILHGGTRHICDLLNLAEYEYEEATEICIDVYIYIIIIINLLFIIDFMVFIRSILCSSRIRF